MTLPGGSVCRNKAITETFTRRRVHGADDFVARMERPLFAVA